jgi:dTDP-4-dehydrorhamnose 3,5-epimerase
MIVVRTTLEGILVITPLRLQDVRGFFLESYHRDRYHAHGITDDFIQDNHSRSLRGVLRGLHFTVKRAQAQLLTVMRGRIYDVVVDLRQGSPTFGRWLGVELGGDGPRQVYMAPGFAHGFCVLSDVADLHYRVSALYDHGDEGGLLWNDPAVGITWPIAAPVISPRDAAYPRLVELTSERLPHIAPSGRT